VIRLIAILQAELYLRVSFFPLCFLFYAFPDSVRVEFNSLVINIGQATCQHKKFFGSSATKAVTHGLEPHVRNGLGRYFDPAGRCARLARQFFQLPVQIPTGQNLKPMQLNEMIAFNGLWTWHGYCFLE